MGLFDCQRGGGSAVGWDVWEGVGFSVFVKPEYDFATAYGHPDFV